MSNIPRDRDELQAPAHAGTPTPIRLKAYYGNLDGSHTRRACMKDQLKRLKAEALSLGVELTFKRFPAVSFSTCDEPESCMIERPECFPSQKYSMIDHGSLAVGNKEGQARMVRGVLGNWCTHLHMLNEVEKEAGQHEYFLVLEDDTIFLEGFLESVLTMIHGQTRFWSLIAIDTWAGDSAAILPHQDAFGGGEFFGKLYSVSQTRDTYWGAHAWLLNGRYAAEVAQLYRATPALPVDLFPKIRHNLDLGMWSYQAEKVKQRTLVQNMTSSFPRSCSDVSGSDINGDGETDVIVQVPTSSRSIRRAVAFVQGQAGGAPMEKTPRELVVLGIAGSGAGFVMDVIKQGLETPLDITLCAAGDKGHCGYIWRQTHPARLLESVAAINDQRARKGLGPVNETVAVVVIRHPFGVSHEVQTSKAVKRFLHCKSGSNEDFLSARCAWEAPKKRGVPPVPRAPCASARQDVPCWESPPAAWTSYLSAAQGLRAVFKDVLILRYEDVLKMPLRALKEMSKAAGLESIWQPQVPHSVLARAETLQMDLFNSDYGCREVKAMCANISLPQLFAHGYHGCQSEWPGYAEMIYHAESYKGVWKPLNVLRQLPEHPSCQSA